MRAKQEQLRPGDVVCGKYRVERVLGRGGMGIVAAAWDTALERRVALKMLRPEGADAESLERFAREARAISQLRSEHIVRVFDVGALEDGAPLLVMEHLVGEDLDTLLSKRSLAIEEAALYALQACEGLAEAHAHGVVHRDVKPANLFVTARPDGRALVKIVDFGVAKQVSRASLVGLTAPAIAVGSVLYMSPEQARALPEITPASDVFSLGICLYEMLTHRQPFTGETSFDILANVIKEMPPPPEAYCPGLPRELSDVVMRCLQKSPADRYPDVAELAEALEPFAGPLGEGTAARARLVLTSARVPPVPPSQRTPVEVVTVSPPRDTRLEPLRRVGSEDETREAPRGTASAPLPRRGRAPVGVLALLALMAAAGAFLLARGRETTAPAAPPAPVASVAVPTAESAAPSGTPTLADAPVTRRPATPTSAPRTPPPRPVVALAPTPRTTTSAAPPAVTPLAPITPITAAATASREPARYDLATARVDLGTARSTFGTSAANVGRALAPLVPRLTACYREALPATTGAVDGAGTLHLETDEDGLVISARLDGPVTSPARCVTSAVRGKRVPNVDTGRASADVPLTFVAR